MSTAIKFRDDAEYLAKFIGSGSDPIFDASLITTQAGQPLTAAEKEALKKMRSFIASHEKDIELAIDTKPASFWASPSQKDDMKKLLHEVAGTKETDFIDKFVNADEKTVRDKTFWGAAGMMLWTASKTGQLNIVTNLTILACLYFGAGAKIKEHFIDPVLGAGKGILTDSGQSLISPLPEVASATPTSQKMFDATGKSPSTGVYLPGLEQVGRTANV